MEEFFRSHNGKRLLNDFHTIAEALKIIAEKIVNEENEESKGEEDESI